MTRDLSRYAKNESPFVSFDWQYLHFLNLWGYSSRVFFAGMSLHKSLILAYPQN
jgi:hypothetical protein